jgi:molecular chaperone GrpE (heat shock protein)
MASLQREFEGKLKYDAHKDEIIDKLHNELQEYKQDILKKHILSIVMDVVKVADDIRKWLTYFRSLEVSQRDPRKLFRYLEAIPSDLEDIFYWHGVRPFSTAEGIFDPARQRAIKKIPSMDASQDKLIAESLRPGYEWDGKVIRQEMVAVYVYQEEQESSTMGMNNE